MNKHSTISSYKFEHIVSGNFTDLRDNQRGIVVDLSGKMYGVLSHNDGSGAKNTAARKEFMALVTRTSINQPGSH